MAKYRLRISHYLEIQDGTQSVHCLGDVEAEPTAGPEKGTIVGDGTPYRVRWPTLEMIPLDADAEAMIKKEEERLLINQGTMNPVEDLPIAADEYEARYIPGMDGRQRNPPLPDGAPARRERPPRQPSA